MIRPWIRLYTDVPNNPKVQRLPAEIFKFWINVLCLSSESGMVPTVENLSYQTRIRPSRVRQHLEKLASVALIEPFLDAPETFQIHNFDQRQFASDLSNERVKAFRKRQRNVTGNASETPSEQSRAEHMTEQSRAEPASPSSPPFPDLPPATIFSEAGREMPNPEFLYVRDALSGAEERIRRARNPLAYQASLVTKLRKEWAKRAESNGAVH